MKANIIIIGDELLIGRVADRNSCMIARELDSIGIETAEIRVVADKTAAIEEAVNEALDNAEVVITTGGLGPTKDDMTKKVLTGIFGGSTVRDENVTANIKSLFAKRNIALNQLTLDQALVPESAEIIQNRFGTAPIMVFHKGQKTLVAMPGVPHETAGMLPAVRKCLLEKYRPATEGHHFTVTLHGISESALAEKLEEFENALQPNSKLAYLPDSPLIRLRLDFFGAEDRFNACTRKLVDTLREIDSVKIVSFGEKPLAERVIEELRIQNLSLSTAESCTGGNIAHMITEVQGASDVYYGSVVSYANSAKTNVLDVSREILYTHGAVSRETVIGMVEGVCRVMSTDCAVATSGIAGPTGGTDDKPVGTVWMAVKTPRGVKAYRHFFPGERTMVINKASTMALIHLLEELGRR